MSWVWHSVFRTEFVGSLPNRNVPHWCEFVAMPIRWVNTTGYPARRSIFRAAAINRSCARRLFGFQRTQMVPSGFRVTRLFLSGRSSDITHQSTLRFAMPGEPSEVPMVGLLSTCRPAISRVIADCLADNANLLLRGDRNRL